MQLNQLPIMQQFNGPTDFSDWLIKRIAYSTSNPQSGDEHFDLVASAIRLHAKFCDYCMIIDREYTLSRQALRKGYLLPLTIEMHGNGRSFGYLANEGDNRLLRDIYNQTNNSRAFRRIADMSRTEGMPFIADQDLVREFLHDNYEILHCSHCDEISYHDLMHDTNGDRVCNECINRSYVWSSYEDQYIYEDEAVSALDSDGDQITITQGNTDFRWCDGLDTYVHYDYQHEDSEPEIIGTYHSSKRHVQKQHDDWSRKHHRFFGVELEVEADGYRHEAARKIHERINKDGDKRLFFENDGSLSNGFEMITHPMSLPAQRELWSFLQDRSLVSEVKSHKSTTCGLHVHVSRDNLTKLQIAKMVAFVNAPQNEDFIRAIARRYQTGYCKIKDKKIGKSHYSDDRYEAVNVTGMRTVEFRLFRGSTRYEAVVAAIEFTNAMVEFSGLATTSVQGLHWKQFLQFCEKKLKSETKIMLPYVESRLKIAA